ncbi:histidine kinase [Streptomyces armeniacus]|uniref:Histidine kinase n=1 Tax=Streptomyces armeniacus TaxID=83291 RepID=A0A345XRP4_9ACTN|nr:histidine kinase [Streptomyces armeniacus]AWS21273.1 two-component sensor histidine kinase [Streptomyces armeniacus]AXK34310.1 histidine kinase [Streptomyces armeniacus]AZY92003.1 putative two-component system sensor kinase [Streptomyces armeniacus]
MTGSPWNPRHERPDVSRKQVQPSTPSTDPYFHAPGTTRLLRQRRALAPNLSRGITKTVIGLVGLTTVLRVGSESHRPWAEAACVALVLGVFALQALQCSAGLQHTDSRRQLWLLGAQGTVALVPLVWFGPEWISMVGPFAGSTLLVLPASLAWPLYCVVMTSMLGFSLFCGLPLVLAGSQTLACALTALVVFGLTRLTDLTYELLAAQSLTHLSVHQERLRFARDLHDLLGYSISAITLKGELSSRLITCDPERARAEILSLMEISRQALADMRQVSRNYRQMSLANEASSASAILAAADIDLDIDISTCSPLSSAMDTLLATTLREGVTNVLRHSNARMCAVRVAHEAEGVRLTMVNDGAYGTNRTPAPRSEGCGIENLRARFRAVGGKVSTEMHDERFTLVAEAPLQQPDRQPVPQRPGESQAM